MRKIEEVSSLIGDIYDAAMDQSLWPGTIGKITTFVGGHAAGLYAKDASTATGGIYYDDGGIEQHYVRLYFDKYIKLDPSTTAHFIAQIGEPMATEDVIPYDEFMETRFYKEWAKPQQLVDCLNVALERSQSNVALFGVFRHEGQGLADAGMRQRLRLLVPHMRRAVVVARLIERKTAETENLTAALDGISAGMFLVDADGRLVHANAAGHLMLQKTDMLQASGGRLHALDPETDRIFRDMFTAAAGGDEALGATGISVPIASPGKDRHVAHVLPLTSGLRRETGSAYKAVAMLFVHKAAIDAPSPPEVIAKTYRLTPTELRVLLGIVEVGGVPEVAEALGIAETTVKTHLGRLYEKTGMNRQADLVKLFAGFRNPLMAGT
jgi:DNA-binding CsgD family transcriptional regulator/PAS domain-containing protein